MCLVLVLAISAASPAWAHKVNIFAYLGDGRIKGEAYSAGGGDKAKTSAVEVVDAQDRLLGSTQTDGQGVFALSLPAGAAVPLHVVLKADMSHQGEYTLSAAELSPGTGTEQGAAAGQTATKDSDDTPSVMTPEPEARLAHLLDQRLQPLTTQLTKLNTEKTVTLHDVMGGLGYTLGL